jgi:hypothetical protein
MHSTVAQQLHACTPTITHCIYDLIQAKTVVNGRRSSTDRTCDCTSASCGSVMSAAVVSARSSGPALYAVSLLLVLLLLLVLVLATVGPSLPFISKFTAFCRHLCTAVAAQCEG